MLEEIFPAYHVALADLPDEPTPVTLPALTAQRAPTEDMETEEGQTQPNEQQRNDQQPPNMEGGAARTTNPTVREKEIDSNP
jgi:hypothetical protein